MLDAIKLRITTFGVGVLVIFLSMLLMSCSSSTPPTAGGGGDEQQVWDAIGIQRCLECHYPTGSVVSDTILADANVVEKWLAGPHGNDESLEPPHNQVNNNPDNFGYPFYFGVSGLTTDLDCNVDPDDPDCDPDPTCTRVCHDQLGDGELLNDLWVATGIADFGIENRPIIGCESCHGDGTQHAESVGVVSPDGFGRPEADSCGQCHNSEFAHNLYTPEGDNIYEDYTEPESDPDIVAHVNSIGAPHYVIYGNSLSGVKALCSKCHTDEGARLYKEVSGGPGALGGALGGFDPVIDATVVQCRTCHDPHNPEKLLFDADVPGGESAEYRTCSNCHQNNGSFGLADAFHGEASGHSWGEPDPAIEDTDKFHADEIIYDTHFDDPTTSYHSARFLDPNDDLYNPSDPNAAPNIIEGYTMDPANERVCRDCHNVHAADNTINNQWAMSAHAGHIIEAKEKAAELYTYLDDAHLEILAAGVQEEDAGAPGYAPAWVHFDWDKTFRADDGNTPDDTDDDDYPDKDRADCQRCHTATGAKNYLTDPAGYDPVKNDFSHLDGWSGTTSGTIDDPSTWGITTSSGQNELLYCWACHSDNAGGLRDPGPITADYTISPDPFPDIAGSNICITCHAGEESGEAIQNPPVDDNDFTSKGFVNSHYLAAGGIIYTAVGYEFTDYSSGTYLHGSASLLDDNGPCIGCHMKTGTAETDESHHLLLPVIKEGDVIQSVVAYDQTCSKCHTTGRGQTAGGMVGLLVELAAGFEAALEALRVELQTDGFYYNSAYPYFFKSVLPIYPNRVTNWGANDGTGMKNMGAAFNYNLLLHEPGAYVHNLQYTQKLIYDSIDHLDGGGLDDSVETTLGSDSDAWQFLDFQPELPAP